MKKTFSKLFILIIIISSLTMCTTVESETDPAEEPAAETVEPAKSAPVTEPTPEPEPEKFVVSEELYVETFGDIRLLIDSLNGIISSKDYETWKTYLTPAYIEYYSNPEQLSHYSELYRQRGYNQRINDFNDYFNYVVVMSRRNAVVDEIIFLDSTHLTAFTKIKEQYTVLYYLEKTENGWKIGLKPEN